MYRGVMTQGQAEFTDIGQIRKCGLFRTCKYGKKLESIVALRAHTSSRILH